MCITFAFAAGLTYLVRLPDSERHLTKIVVGTCVQSSPSVLVKGLFTPDEWDHWQNHRLFDQPLILHGTACDRGAKGIRLALGAYVPLADLARDRWPQMEGHEAWQGDPPPGIMGLFEFGQMYRKPDRYAYPGDLGRETASMLRAAARGQMAGRHV